MATIRAFVYKEPVVRGVLGDSYKVFPPVVILSKNDKFQLVNATDQDVLLTIPPDVFSTPANRKKVDKGKKSAEFSPRENLEIAIGVQYEVEVDGKKATANSDPVIIIDP